MLKEAEINRKHSHLMSEGLDSAKHSYLEKLSALSGKLRGLSETLEERATTDKKIVESQKLWVACSALNASLNSCKPLVDEVVLIRSAANPEDNFVRIVLASLSPLALDRGVYSLNSLKERFIKVQDIASRVAGVGEGGSLLREEG